jgi:hypothetical protein
VLWASTFVGLGYLFGDQVTWVLRGGLVYGRSILGVALAIVVVWLAYKLIQRERVRRKLHVDRIRPTELQQLLQEANPPLVLDLRHRRELVDDPHTLPGALQVSPSELPSRHSEIPRNRDVVLFCS